MSAQGRAEHTVATARSLVHDIRVESFTIDEARNLVHQIREAEGWLLSARRLLDPEEARTDGS